MKVICKQSFSSQPNITTPNFSGGKEYDVIGEAKDYYIIRDDFGTLQVPMPVNFEIIHHYPPQKYIIKTFNEIKQESILHADLLINKETLEMILENIHEITPEGFEFLSICGGSEAYFVFKKKDLKVTIPYSRKNIY